MFIPADSTAIDCYLFDHEEEILWIKYRNEKNDKVYGYRTGWRLFHEFEVAESKGVFLKQFISGQVGTKYSTVPEVISDILVRAEKAKLKAALFNVEPRRKTYRLGAL